MVNLENSRHSDLCFKSTYNLVDIHDGSNCLDSASVSQKFQYSMIPALRINFHRAFDLVEKTEYGQTNEARGRSSQSTSGTEMSVQFTRVPSPTHSAAFSLGKGDTISTR